MKANIRKTKGFDGHCNIYQVGERGYAYNPCLREWELFYMASDGSIQDLHDRVKTRRDAELWANGRIVMVN